MGQVRSLALRGDERPTFGGRALSPIPGLQGNVERRNHHPPVRQIHPTRILDRRAIPVAGDTSKQNITDATIACVVFERGKCRTARGRTLVRTRRCFRRRGKGTRIIRLDDIGRSVRRLPSVLIRLASAKERYRRHRDENHGFHGNSQEEADFTGISIGRSKEGNRRTVPTPGLIMQDRRLLLR